MNGEQDWRALADARIDALRKRDVEIQCTDATGEPRRGVSLAVRQVRHRFGFGSAITRGPLNNERYAERFAQLFEWAVCENESKWYANEPQRGRVTYADADAIVDFCRSHGIRMRGHALFWSVPKFVQEWVKELSLDDLARAIVDRSHGAAEHFRGAFEHWDVNNEMLHGSWFAERFGREIRPWMFRRMRALVPEAKLFVNDYNVLAGSKSGRYARQVRSLMRAGAPVDGIGAQCHFGAVDPRRVQRRLDRLARAGLPIWCTEFDSQVPRAEERADHLENFMRVAFAHPSVEGVLLWGFWEKAHWRGAEAALFDADLSPNPAGERWLALREDWTTKVDLTTDDSGRAHLRGFHGTYELRLPDNETRTVEVEPGLGRAIIAVETR